jgi:hypothetical protein
MKPACIELFKEGRISKSAGSHQLPPSNLEPDLDIQTGGNLNTGFLKEIYRRFLSSILKEHSSFVANYPQFFRLLRAGRCLDRPVKVWICLYPVAAVPFAVRPKPYWIRPAPGMLKSWQGSGTPSL